MTDYSPRYLVMVTEDNHNKFYKQIPHGDTWTAEYGRVGCSVQKKNYPMSQWDRKYNEKIRKGYRDNTELVKEIIESEENKTDGNSISDIENKAIAEIVARLQKYAKTAISENYTISDNSVTHTMVDAAQSILDELASKDVLDKTSVKSFNESLIALFNTIPRKMDKVQLHLASVKDDFAKILKREQDLLDVMKGQVVQNASVAVSEEGEAVRDDKVKTNILEKLGLEFHECDKSEISVIKSKLGSCSGKFKVAWRVVNVKTQSKFDKFVNDESISKRDLLWHGSRNENWWSIINLGLILNPTNVVVSGSMFGHGLYFANKAKKSFGYTSGYGSYWASGSSNTAFLALFDVAVGKSFRTKRHRYDYYSYDWKSFRQSHSDCHSFFAEGGADLRNDEIIVYRDDQCTIKYLVELECL